MNTQRSRQRLYLFTPRIDDPEPFLRELDAVLAWADRLGAGDLVPLLARHPGRVFWVPSQNRIRAAAAHGCVVVRQRMAADDYWLGDGIYMDHWILRETVPVAPSAHLLTLPGTVDLTSRLSVG